MEVKAGYKQTGVGVIPSDWKVARLGSIVDQERSIRYGIVQPGRFDPNGRFMIRGQDYSFGWVEPSQFFRVSGAVEERYKNARVASGDVIMTIVGAGTGIVTVVPEWLEGANLTQTTARIAIDLNKANNIFCLNFFRTRHGARQVQEKIKGGAQPGLNCGDIVNFLVPIPPLPEQRAIATALSDVDALINSLDRLIAKKRDMKQAAMQELLTGRRRLSGFGGGWESSTLRGAAEIQSGINKSISEMGSGTLYVTVQDLYDGTSINIQRLGRIRVSPQEIQAKALAAGDIVFGKSSVKREGIGYPSQFLGCGEPVVFSGFTYRARARQGIADATFLFYALRSTKTRRWLIDNSQASALTNINQSIADAVPILLPPLPEQAAIVTVLSDMDTEIVAQEQKRDKTIALKQGMMQELLTGRIRLLKPSN